uniref:Uncharacterized protein n=1 Tax=Branchiostoma floridae TaxID=7739 RepID=C3YSW9_BRAFL|eukprot:XP_002600621.1 hypothetical protein BRAFLDRAFT_95135 [Branchiostoma floridae]
MERAVIWREPLLLLFTYACLRLLKTAVTYAILETWYDNIMFFRGGHTRLLSDSDPHTTGSEKRKCAYLQENWRQSLQEEASIPISRLLIHDSQSLFRKVNTPFVDTGFQQAVHEVENTARSDMQQKAYLLATVSHKPLFLSSLDGTWMWYSHNQSQSGRHVRPGPTAQRQRGGGGGGVTVRSTTLIARRHADCGNNPDSHGSPVSQGILHQPRQTASRQTPFGSQDPDSQGRVLERVRVRARRVRVKVRKRVRQGPRQPAYLQEAGKEAASLLDEYTSTQKNIQAKSAVDSIEANTNLLE